MGAYGSPELPPNNPSNNYGYGYHYQKPKGETGGCLKNGLIAVGLLLVFFVVFGLASSMINGGSPRVNNSAAQTVASAQVYSQPVYIPPASTSSFSAPTAPVVVDDSLDFLQGWVKPVILKCLVYSDTATFSDNSNDWKIVRDGKVCEISSIVYARGQNTKKNVPNTFIVRISYDDLKADVIFVSINGKVCYDSSKTSKSK